MILGTSRAVRVFAYPEPVDLRKGYDGLFGLVKTGLGRDPLSGDLFLFVGKRRTGCKVLIWDGTGLCIFKNGSSKDASLRCSATTIEVCSSPRASSRCS
jgi:transposase